MVIIDAQGRIVHVNAQTESLFGHSRDRMLGAGVELLIPERFRAGHPSHRSEYFRKPHPRPMGAAGVELFGLRADGTEFPAEVSLSPLVSNGETMVIAAIRDGTTRKRVDDKFRRLLEVAPDAMVISNRQGHIVLVNTQAETLFGYAREELIGRPVEMLIPERYRAAHPGHRHGYFESSRTRPMGAGRLALFGLRQDGSEFPAEISLSPLQTEEGLLAITAIRDVTDRKRAEEERAKLSRTQEALRMRDEFLSIASHELRTPLTALQMQIDSVLRAAQKPGSDGVVHHITARAELMQRSVARLSKLIDQLLDLSRITAGRLTLHVEPFDFCTVVRGAVEQFHDELQRAACELRLQLPQTPIIGSWDSMRLEQIVSNLLSNAIKYGPGKPIELRVTEIGGEKVSLSVRDHGIGIASEHQTRIFDRFERFVSERNYGGFGLGLWIVRQTIDAHRGSIRVWSQPGAGSTFTVELPRRCGAENRPETSPSSRRSVMLIDDDPIIGATVEGVLGDEGYEVTVARNGIEALEMLRAGPTPSLIFLDLMMPKMDGRAFRTEQLKDPTLSRIPVIVFSASGKIESDARELGAAGHLRKPIQLKRLLEMIERFC